MILSQIDRIVEVLISVSQKPLMYFGAYDHERVTIFLHGFHMALGLSSVPQPSLELVKDAYVKRGWSFNALGALPDMEAKGLLGEEIVKEMILAEIAAWKTLRSNIELGN